MAVPLLLSGGLAAAAANDGSDSPPIVSVSSSGTGQGSTPTTTPTTWTTPSTGDTASDGVTDDAVSSGSSVAQIVAVSVFPGPLTVTPSTASVVFGPSTNGTSDGTLPEITVVDARGSLVGWRATVTLQSINGIPTTDLAQARLCLRPSAAVAVAGRQSEVRTGHHHCGVAGDPLTLFFAPPDGGGGTFDDSGRVTLQLPGAPDASSFSATLAVAVH